MALPQAEKGHCLHFTEGETEARRGLPSVREGTAVAVVEFQYPEAWGEVSGLIPLGLGPQGKAHLLGRGGEAGLVGKSRQLRGGWKPGSNSQGTPIFISLTCDTGTTVPTGWNGAQPSQHRARDAACARGFPGLQPLCSSEALSVPQTLQPLPPPQSPPGDPALGLRDSLPFLVTQLTHIHPTGPIRDIASLSLPPGSLP